MRFVVEMALVLAWQISAAAAPVRVIYLPLAGVGAEPDARIDETLSAELVEQPQLFVQVPGPKKTKTEAWHVRKTDRSWIDAAQKAIEANNYDSAITKLKKGIAAEWKKPDDTGAIADAELLLSVAQFRRGNEDDGQRALTEFVRLRPDAKLVGDYPPLFIRLHEQARKRWLSKSVSALRVDIDADVDGVITVNGHEVGRAPLVLEHLPLGPQLIAFVNGGTQIVHRVEASTALACVCFNLAGPRRNPLARNALVRWSKAELAELARSEGAAFAVTGAMVSNGAGAGHTLAVVLVSSSGEGAVASTVKLAEAPSGWGVEMNRLGARVAQLASTGLKDGDQAPLLDVIVPGVKADGLMHYDFFAKPEGDARPRGDAAVVPPPELPTAVVASPAATPAAKVPILEAAPASLPLAPVKASTESIHANPESPRMLTHGPLDTPEMPPEIRKPVYKQWWLWTLVSAAVVGGVVAAVVVSTAKVNQVQVNATW